MTDENFQRLLDVDDQYARYLARKNPPRPTRAPRGVSHRDRILELFRSHPRSIYSTADVDTTLGLSVHQRLTELTREGHLTRLEDGRYQWAGSN
jgi:hypothetical protein